LWARAAALESAEAARSRAFDCGSLSLILGIMTATPTRHWLEYVDWASPVLAEPLQVEL
jgi:mandelate racemase